VHCLAKNARLNGRHGKYERWSQCEICNQDYTDPAYSELAELWWKDVHSRSKQDNERILSALNLAISFSGRAKHHEAVEIIHDVLSVREEICGLQHPDTLKTRSLLGSLYVDLGQEAKAETLLRDVLIVQQTVLEAGHEDTLTTMSHLANSLYYQKRYAEAEQMVRKVLLVQKQVLGVEHKDTLTNMCNLANSLCEQGKYTQAEEMMREALLVQTRVLGLEHPNTLLSTENLNTLLRLQGKHNGQQVREHRSGQCYPRS
jgi:tetratricopeptide (TPR) repeat protein